MSEWQPLETAPIDGTNILLWFSYPEQQRVVYGRYVQTCFYGPCWEYDGEYTVCLKDGVVTHWMPLPNPPTKGN